MEKSPTDKLWVHWAQGNEITIATCRDILKGCDRATIKQAWEQFQSFLKIPQYPAPHPQGSLAEALEYLLSMESPDDFAIFDVAITDRATKEEAWRQLPEDEKARIKPLIQAYKSQ